jgi:hypothetical protein
MKILLILAGCIILLILGVITIGGILPKRHIVSRRASYRATPEKLFSLIAGPRNWRPEILHSEVVPGAGGREILRETSRKGRTTIYELVDSSPPISITRRIAMKNLPYSGSWTYSLQPTASGTIVRITEDGKSIVPYFASCPLSFSAGQVRWTRTCEHWAARPGRK